mmetsp:Transcript_12522/g.27000  ORF Transcript_12522/g.27000 Transcript_12522/m.27000 type:complete len:269 (-) Transcript_12522:360-1166(-)
MCRVQVHTRPLHVGTGRHARITGQRGAGAAGVEAGAQLPKPHAGAQLQQLLAGATALAVGAQHRGDACGGLLVYCAVQHVAEATWQRLVVSLQAHDGVQQPLPADPAAAVLCRQLHEDTHALRRVPLHLIGALITHLPGLQVCLLHQHPQRMTRVCVGVHQLLVLGPHHHRHAAFRHRPCCPPGAAPLQHALQHRLEGGQAARVVRRVGLKQLVVLGCWVLQLSEVPAPQPCAQVLSLLVAHICDHAHLAAPSQGLVGVRLLGWNSLS